MIIVKVLCLALYYVNSLLEVHCIIGIKYVIYLYYLNKLV